MTGSLLSFTCTSKTNLAGFFKKGEREQGKIIKKGRMPFVFRKWSTIHFAEKLKSLAAFIKKASRRESWPSIWRLETWDSLSHYSRKSRKNFCVVRVGYSIHLKISLKKWQKLVCDTLKTLFNVLQRWFKICTQKCLILQVLVYLSHTKIHLFLNWAFSQKFTIFQHSHFPKFTLFFKIHIFFFFKFHICNY